MNAVTSDAVRQYLADIEKNPFFGPPTTDLSFAFMVSYYRKGAGRARVRFRTCGFAVIALSAALPFIAAFAGEAIGDHWKDVVLSSISVLVALAAGLNGFFHWDDRWREALLSLFRLQELHAAWEQVKVDALYNPDNQQAMADLSRGAHSFIENAYAVTKSEMVGYFKNVQFPGIKASQAT